jgi:preprotein translocase subunit SecG
VAVGLNLISHVRILLLLVVVNMLQIGGGGGVVSSSSSSSSNIFCLRRTYHLSTDFHYICCILAQNFTSLPCL